MTKKKSIAVPAQDAPQNLDQANELLAEIGRLARRMDTETIARDAAVAKATEKFQPEIDTLAAELKVKVAAIQSFAEANKAALLADGERSVTLSQGTFGWRLGNPAVKLDSKVEEAHLVAALKKLGLSEFVRVSETLNRSAILNEPDKVESVRGLTIEQSEAFYVKPLTVEDEIAGKARKLKGAAASQAADADPQPKKRKVA